MPDWMSDPMTWSVPAGRYFGIRVKVHVFFILLTVPRILHALIARGAEEFWWTLGWSVVLFFSVLFHEFGHCFAARAVRGDADEIMMWPLGGLAFVSVPNTARAHFIATVWGPLVNVIICAITGAILGVYGYLPPINPFAPLEGAYLNLGLAHPLTWVGITFGINWILLLFNMIPAFPMDAGRMLRSALWTRVGFGRATLYAVQVAKICAIVMGIVGFVQMMGETRKAEGLQLVFIACFIYWMSERERQLLAAGMLFDESLFGYDFSQGYTSLERGAAKTKARPLSTWERWRRRRERLKQQRALAAQHEEERRVDSILEKLHREGMSSLTDQEKQFLTRASEKYRSRDRTD